MEAAWFDEFYSEGLITEVVGQLKSGKEATVFVCRGGPASDAKLLAVKHYRHRLGRGFQNRAIYQHGRVTDGSRPTRAVANKTRFGRRVEEVCWVAHEFDMLCQLHFAGADVPTPVAATGSAILMEFVGDEESPARQLREIRPDEVTAQRLFSRLIWNVERFLANNVVHSDLSAFNILVRDGRAIIIDLPQAVDPRTNHNARELLGHDVACLCGHFARFGIRADAGAISNDLWRRFRDAQMRC